MENLILEIHNPAALKKHKQIIHRLVRATNSDTDVKVHHTGWEILGYGESQDKINSDVWWIMTGIF